MLTSPSQSVQHSVYPSFCLCYKFTRAALSFLLGARGGHTTHAALNVRLGAQCNKNNQFGDITCIFFVVWPQPLLHVPCFLGEFRFVNYHCKHQPVVTGNKLVVAACGGGASGTLRQNCSGVLQAAKDKAFKETGSLSQCTTKN